MPEMSREELAEAYAARVAAELVRADSELPGSDSVAASGDASASVLLVKGEPGPAEIGGGRALAGADGEAIAKALGALGRDAADTYAVLSRPVTDPPQERVTARLRRIIEVCDPRWVVALDPRAAHDVALALGMDPPPPGEPTIGIGRTVLALDGLEASLADDSLKRKVWSQLKALENA
jgi:hypothetical protein